VDWQYRFQDFQDRLILDHLEIIEHKDKMNTRCQDIVDQGSGNRG
jgi:hypothetical protein